MTRNLENLIEAILFHKAESMKRKKLCDLLNVSLDELNTAIDSLKTNLLGRGINLAIIGDEVMLRTSPETSEVIEQITKEDLNKDLGKAGLETLAIILYNHPISTRDIEYIRGVKSSFILRNLTMRGLIERIQNPNDSRSYLFQPSFDTLGYLGLNEVSELPEYAKTKEALARFADEKEDEENEQ